MLPIASGMIAV